MHERCGGQKQLAKSLWSKRLWISRDVMNVSRECIFLFLLMSDLALSINAGRNRLRAQHKETFRQQICMMLTQPQPKKNNKKTEVQSLKWINDSYSVLGWRWSVSHACGQRKWLNVILKFCNVINTVNRSTAGTKKRALMLIREATGLSFKFSDAP